MFDRKTVFILGAGASWHYNYPTGDELVKSVLSKLKGLINCYDSDWRRYQINLRQRSPTGPLGKIDSICEIMGDNQAQNLQVIDFLKNFHDRLEYVNPPVIDYFFQFNEDLREIGKLMIAWVILECESQYEKSGNKNRVKIGQRINEQSDDWYRFIIYKMLIGCEDYNDVFANNVDFITFNYDVSLDRFLYKGLRQIAFMKPDSVADDELKRELKKRIHHVYGYVRESDQFSDLKTSHLDPGNNTVQAHEEILTSAYSASQNIDTIAGLKREIPKHVLNKIEEAQDIYVLGFGFDAMNCDSLEAVKYFSYGGARACVIDKDYRRFFFTNFNDYNSVNKKVSKIFGLPEKNRFMAGSGKMIYEDYGGLPSGTGTGGVHYEKSIKNVYDAISQDFDLI